MARRRQDETATADAVTVRLPCCEPDEVTYIARETGHLDLYLKGEALDTFRRVHAGLVEGGSRMASGKPVSSKADVIQWLFEQAACDE